MIKVGILTMYYANYSHGGLLQAFSLRKYIEELGCECEQIAYDYNKNFSNKHNGFSIVKSKVAQILMYFIRKRNSDNTIEIYNDFIDDIPHSQYCDKDTFDNIISKYDKVVVGGDQVWNYEYCDRNFFVPQLKNKKKISYSASAGRDVFSSDEKKMLCDGVNTFHNISVRENILHQMLEEELPERQISCVIDPVFLMNSTYWKKFLVKPKIDRDYVLVYLLGYDLNEKEKVKQLSEKIGLPVVFIPYANIDYTKGEADYGDVQAWNVGPREFLGLINEAKYVLTDSFHGTAFSILLNKDFYVFDRPNKGFSMNSRILSLLQMADLQERYVDLNKISEVQIKGVDYTRANDKIEKYISYSKNWIREALLS